MDKYIVALILAIIFCIIIWFSTKQTIIPYVPASLKSNPKQSITKQSPSISNCQGEFPPQPTTIPDSAYAQLVQPFIKTSSLNPNTSPTVKIGLNGLPVTDANYTCNTPSDKYCVNNDLCSRYGIGEKCFGPEGYARCVCDVRQSDGKIGYGAVCTTDDQCCTNYCRTSPGLDSKFCDCPVDNVWDEKQSKCIPLPSVSVYRPIMPPLGSCKDASGRNIQGQSCNTDSDCVLGSACTPDKFCNCLLSTQGDFIENRFKIGAICTDTNQCMPNLECNSSKCACPSGLIYDKTTNYCVCPDPTYNYIAETQTCYPPDNTPRKICPSKGGQCNDDRDVGLGEACDAISHVAVCHAKDLPYSDLIFYGGKCSDNTQCVTGSCKLSANGLSYCR